MSLRRRVGKMLGWGAFLVLAIALGGMIAAYFYVTDSATLADLIRRESPKYLPGCRVDALEVRIRPLWGDVTLKQLQVREVGEGSTDRMIANAYRVVIRFDPWAMLKGRFEPRDVAVSRPKVRLRQRPDGSWNVQGLLADPFPLRAGGPIPPISIQEGIVELWEDGAKAPLTLLRDVSIKVPAAMGSTPTVPFDLTAKGDTGLFDRIHAEGAFDPETGRVALHGGELVRFSLSEDDRHRLPAPARDWLAKAGLDDGEIDADLPELTFDPESTPRFHYRASAKLRRGLWKCPKLPFPVSDLGVHLEAKDGELTILSAHGTDGPTGLALKGKATLNLDDPARSTFRVVAEANNLELDLRLRDWIPAKDRELWDAYFPGVKATPTTSAGRVNLAAVVSRDSPQGEIEVVSDVQCLDVSLRYKHFAYPVDHVNGTIHATRKQMVLDVRTKINDRPLRVTGTVDDPGPDAVARLVFEVESLPINPALFSALPPEVKPTVALFNPSGTVKGRAELERLPPLKKGDDPRGRVKFDAWIELNPGCSVTWEGLKYPVRNLTGKLEIHPDLWIFREMSGSNGQASILVDGQVEQLNRTKPKVGGDRLKVDVKLRARNLPFDQQLRDALPAPWKVTWATLNPSGATDIDATIAVDPNHVPAQHDRIVIVPRGETNVKLRFNPLAGPGERPAPGQIELRMDDVGGTFVYDTSDTPHTSMTDVHFQFHGAPVTFVRGAVDVRDNGEFNLGVSRLEVVGLRLDEELRRYMPPVMAHFSRRLEDKMIPKIKANLGLGWSGKAGESAWCRWDEAMVVLNNNKVSIGADFALDHIQGQLAQVEGWFNGRDFGVRGQLELDSVSVLGQQITDLTANLDVKQGWANLDEIKAEVLGGALNGHVRASLETSPSYSIGMVVRRADLQKYAMNQPGHQTFKGMVDARVELAGLGYDPHTISGNGMAQVAQGDFGTLPVALRFVNVLQLSRDSKKETKTAFDSAEVAFRIQSGDTTLDPVRLVGNAFTLDGKGTLDVRGEIDLKLHIYPGRDSFRIPLISGLTRELSSQILAVHVHGPAAAPSFKPEPIPGPGELLLKAQRRKADAWRTGLETRRRGGIAARWFGTGDE